MISSQKGTFLQYILLLLNCESLCRFHNVICILLCIMIIFSLQVKPGSDFVSVLDMYYKVHKLFGIDFCADCDQFMIFLDHFVYLHQDTRYKPNVKTVRISKHLL